jgi:hypothetical protein
MRFHKSLHLLYLIQMMKRNHRTKTCLILLSHIDSYFSLEPSDLIKQQIGQNQRNISALALALPPSKGDQRRTDEASAMRAKIR